MADLASYLSAAGAAAVAVLASAVSYGATRQKVSDLQERLDRQDENIARLTAAIEKTGEVAAAVDRLSDKVTASNTLNASQQASADKLVAERFESLRGEVRAFMLGAGRARARTIARG